MFDIKEARKICEAATAGPWRYDCNIFDIKENYYRKLSGFYVENKGYIFSTDDEPFPEDIKFITFARTTLPTALDEIERLRTEIKRTDEKYKLVKELIFGDMTVSFAAIDAVKERQRQVNEERFTGNHDDRINNCGQLAQAAAVYALPENDRCIPVKHLDTTGNTKQSRLLELLWPWNEGWYKPGNRRQELLKAAALIIAEIERLDRMKVRDINE